MSVMDQVLEYIEEHQNVEIFPRDIHARVGGDIAGVRIALSRVAIMVESFKRVRRGVYVYDTKGKRDMFRGFNAELEALIEDKDFVDFNDVLDVCHCDAAHAKTMLRGSNEYEVKLCVVRKEG